MEREQLTIRVRRAPWSRKELLYLWRLARGHRVLAVGLTKGKEQAQLEAAEARRKVETWPELWTGWSRPDE